ncbi:hypothetical protein C8R44DRAFT_857756 [Mycena epipterygia]|nr:hypothetical protein C8R44DRAFT_857756 [Mycena epipterygia]
MEEFVTLYDTAKRLPYFVLFLERQAGFKSELGGGGSRTWYHQIASAGGNSQQFTPPHSPPPITKPSGHELAMKNDVTALKATPPPPPAAFLPAITFYLGGWDLGICADLILQGVVFAQIAHYTTLYAKDAKDGLVLRAFVAVLLIITTLKSAQALVILWIQNVQHFMDVSAALNMFTTSWTTEANLVLIAIIAFYVQLFFCNRLWSISRNLYIVALIVTLFVFALIAAIVSCVFTFAGKSKNVTWSKEAVETFSVSIHLGTVFAGDVLLCGCTIYSLLRHSKHASPETAGILNAITRLTFQSAAPAAVCALINLIGTVAWDGTEPNAYIMLSLIANNMLPKLYAISAMWTLNYRKEIRRAHSIGPQSSTPVSGRPPMNDMELDGIELGSLSVSSNRSVPIQIQTPRFNGDVNLLHFFTSNVARVEVRRSRWGRVFSGKHDIDTSLIRRSRNADDNTVCDFELHVQVEQLQIRLNLALKERDDMKERTSERTTKMLGESFGTGQAPH